MRQLASSLQLYPGGNQEYAYSIQYNSILTLVKTQNITSTNEPKWVSTFTDVSTLGDLEVYTQITQTAPATGNTPILVTNY